MSDLDTTTLSPLTSPASTEVGLAALGKHDDRHREAYRLKRTGQKIADIAAAFGVDVRTIHRWIQAYHDEYRRTLEEAPVVNLIAEELAKLEEIELTARGRAAECRSSIQQRGFLAIALKAIQARHDLLLEVGVLPREPTKIYAAIKELCEPPAGSAGDTEKERSDDEVRKSIVNLVRRSRQLS